MSEIADNWRRVRARVDAAAGRVGRDPAGIRVVVASKTKSVDEIEQAIAAGAVDFGENYVQEAGAKIPLLRARPVTWHLIGHLQRNKAARAAELFDVVQTIDSSALAAALARQAAERQRRLRVLIEVNLGGEEAKSGVVVDEVAGLASTVLSFPSLELDGLMAIPPAPEDAGPEASRPHFRRLRELRDDLAMRLGARLPQLSMGMSDDYEIAIEEGATMVRIGRAILGARPPRRDDG